MTFLVLSALIFAAWPALLFLGNLRRFTPPAPRSEPAPGVSILIPARDEEINIGAAVTAALTNTAAEVLVLDDHSTDRTREILQSIAQTEPRLRVLAGAPLPAGWCGKNWACAQLADAASHPLLLFVDADVRLEANAAATLAAWLQESGAQLASGVPRQLLGTPSEKLLIPLIHFILLGFLPLDRMRRSRHPAYATGCGQLAIADAAAYRVVNGHRAIQSRIHDGIALARSFRLGGFQTDLFDATELATCRMYRNDRDTWRGFSKNTHEGLGAPARIGPATMILLAGQVLPFVLLALAPRLSTLQLGAVVLAAGLAVLPRLLSRAEIHATVGKRHLPPVGVLALLGIQWVGLVRFLRNQPAHWKGRRYVPVVPSLRPALLAGDRVPLADAGKQIPERVQHAIDGSFHGRRVLVGHVRPATSRARRRRVRDRLPRAR